MTPVAPGSNSSVQPAAASRASVAEIDDLQFEAGLFGNALPEYFAVFGGAAGFGRYQSGARRGHAPRAHLVAAHQQRIDRALDRRFADSARGGDALAEADNARERVDDAKTVRRRTRNQEPAIVSAEVERGIGRIGTFIREAGRLVPSAAVPA